MDQASASPAELMTKDERVERAEMRLGVPVNILVSAALLSLSRQRAALLAEPIVGRPFESNHQVELSWPLRTVMAEMPRLATSMCSVFHGKVAFPFLSSPIRKV